MFVVVSAGAGLCTGCVVLWSYMFYLGTLFHGVLFVFVCVFILLPLLVCGAGGLWYYFACCGVGFVVVGCIKTLGWFCRWDVVWVVHLCRHFLVLVAVM